jgi:hypothetical protein
MHSHSIGRSSDRQGTGNSYSTSATDQNSQSSIDNRSSASFAGQHSHRGETDSRSPSTVNRRGVDVKNGSYDSTASSDRTTSDIDDTSFLRDTQPASDADTTFPAHSAPVNVEKAQSEADSGTASVADSVAQTDSVSSSENGASSAESSVYEVHEIDYLFASIGAFVLFGLEFAFFITFVYLSVKSVNIIISIIDYALTEEGTVRNLSILVFVVIGWLILVISSAGGWIWFSPEATAYYVISTILLLGLGNLGISISISVSTS